MTYTPTVSNTRSTRPTSSSPPSYDGVTMTVVLQLDQYSSETSWSISDGITNFASRPVGYYEEMQSQLVLEKVLLPRGSEYQFQISDYMGDGMKGYYSLYMGEDIEDDSAQLFNHTGNVSTYLFGLLFHIC